jgi:hypothetical protein
MVRAPRLWVLVVAALFAASPARAEEGALDARLAEKAPTIVTVKVVLKRGDQESTREFAGTLVDASGTVMTSASQIAPGKWSPVQIHVLFGNDPTENPAVLVARDSTLRLAYVQVLDKKGLPAVDLTKGATTKIGQDLFTVTRSTRSFDFTPSIVRLYVTGKLEKPRPLWDFAGDSFAAGLPAFDLSGAPVGVVVDQLAPRGVESGGAETEYFILPLDAAVRSLEMARTRIPEALETAKKEAEEKKEEATPPEEGAAADAPTPPGAPTPPDPEPPGDPKPPEEPKPPEQPVPGGPKGLPEGR